jgi:hypothetical protein
VQAGVEEEVVEGVEEEVVVGAVGVVEEAGEAGEVEDPGGVWVDMEPTATSRGLRPVTGTTRPSPAPHKGLRMGGMHPRPPPWRRRMSPQTGWMCPWMRQPPPRTSLALASP